MLSRVFRRMAAENGKKIPSEEVYQSLSERQVETPKGGLSETGLTDPVIDPTEPPKKEGHQSSCERQAETPKRGFSEMDLTERVIDSAELPKKTGRFGL